MTLLNTNSQLAMLTFFHKRACYTLQIHRNITRAVCFCYALSISLSLSLCLFGLWQWNWGKGGGAFFWIEICRQQYAVPCIYNTLFASQEVVDEIFKCEIYSLRWSYQWIINKAIFSGVRNTHVNACVGFTNITYKYIRYYTLSAVVDGVSLR